MDGRRFQHGVAIVVLSTAALLCASPALDSASSGYWLIAGPPSKKQLSVVKRAVDHGLTSLAGAVRCVSGGRFDDLAAGSMAMIESWTIVRALALSTQTIEPGNEPVVWSIADLRASLINLPPPIA